SPGRTDGQNGLGRGFSLIRLKDKRTADAAYGEDRDGDCHGWQDRPSERRRATVRATGGGDRRGGGLDKRRIQSGCRPVSDRRFAVVSVTGRTASIETAYSVRWWRMTGATLPCSDSAATASAVMFARVAAPFMTKRNGFPAFLTMSTVAPMARRSCGLGRAGMRTKSAMAITRSIDAVRAGGVSISAHAACPLP